MESKLHSGDILLNRSTKEHWKTIMVDDEVGQAIISCQPYGYRVVNIKGIEIDYILPNGE